MITSCSNTPPDADISAVRLEFNIARFDRDLFNDSQKTATYTAGLHHQYGDFFEIYTDKIINAGAAQDPTLHIALQRFTSDPDIKTVYTDIQKTYSELQPEEAQLRDAFKRYMIYFENRPVPNVLAMHSAFNYSVAVLPEKIAIGMDMYLGASYNYYSALQIPQYRRRTMHRAHIVPDVIKGWISTEFMGDSLRSDLLGEMLHEGRILYVCKRLLPGIQDTLITGFSDLQTQWCKDNERNMWGFLIEKKMLFSQQAAEYRKLLSDGPFTPGFDRQSPARAITWLGWRMVEKYMEKYPATTLPELMHISEGQTFLQQSGYKPG